MGAPCVYEAAQYMYGKPKRVSIPSCTGITQELHAYGLTHVCNFIHSMKHNNNHNIDNTPAPKEYYFNARVESQFVPRQLTNKPHG